MTTIDIDETTRNQILAALDERAARLGIEIERLQEPPRDEFLERACPACGLTIAAADTHWSLYPSPMGGYVCPDWQRALVWNIAALHETNMARLQVAEAGEPVPTLAETVPWEPARSYHDQQAR